MPALTPRALDIAVIGAGPVGLALALHAARGLPHARISVFDRREAAQDVSGDPRTLALSLGSVQLLQRLGAWPRRRGAADPRSACLAAAAHAAPPAAGWAEPEVRIRAAEEGVPMLGAVLGYGAVVAPLQQAWLDAARATPQRLLSRFGTRGGGAEARWPTAWRWTPASPKASTWQWWPKAVCSPSRRARRWPATTARPPGSARPRWPARTPALA